MTSKMFLDIVGVIITSKLSILSTFQGGAQPPPCQVGLMKLFPSFELEGYLCNSLKPSPSLMSVRWVTQTKSE